MAAREFLLITQESAYNTPVTSPTMGTNQIAIRLNGGNAFSMQTAVEPADIAYGGGFDVLVDSVNDCYMLTGQLKTWLYPSQAAFLLGWALSRINSDQTAPWTTTEPVGDLASCTLQHAILNSDGSQRPFQYSGAKVTSVEISVSRESKAASLTLGLVASKAAPNAIDSTAAPSAFTAPADTDYPTGPYNFRQTSGYLSLGGTVRSMYQDLSIKVNNTIDARQFEAAYVQVARCLGRRSTLDSTLLLKSTPDDRSAYEAVTAQAASLIFTTGTTGTNLTIQYNGNNRISEYKYELPINQLYTYGLTLMNRYDPSVSTDVGFSLA